MKVSTVLSLAAGIAIITGIGISIIHDLREAKKAEDYERMIENRFNDAIKRKA